MQIVMRGSNAYKLAKRYQEIGNSGSTVSVGGNIQSKLFMHVVLECKNMPNCAV